MRLAFIDPSGWDFNVETPLQRPLGGSHSAACYLAIALAARGHEVFFITATSAPGNIRGVTCISTRSVPPAEMPSNLDAAVVLMAAGPGTRIREALGRATKLVLWTGHATDQRAVGDLRNPASRTAFDGFALVSEWQRQGYLQTFALPAERTAVLRNAVAPAFLEQFAPGESVLAAKTRPPILAYTSTPYRGLAVLMRVFPAIRQRVPDARLAVFSDMSIYLSSEQDDEKKFGELYRLCRETEGVDYVGALAQPLLAARLREVALLAYSNTFVETSCISVLEAMACGCRVITSELGALPETTAGFARLVPVAGGAEEYERQFIDQTVAALSELDSPDTADLLVRQVQFIAKNYTWDTRAEEWTRWLSDLPLIQRTHARLSAEQRLPLARLPRNEEPLDPYFGTFLGLLRRNIAAGGSEFGLGLTLFSLAASIRARAIVEIGRFKGFSTLALASALRMLDIGWDEPDQHKQRPDINYPDFEARKPRMLYSLDSHPTPEAQALLEEAKLLPYVTLIDRPSQGVTFQGEVDLIFIDGDHSYRGCLADVQRFVPSTLRPGGYFILHDYFGWYRDGVNTSPVKKVIDELIRQGHLQHLLIDTGYMSFVIFRKPGA